MPEDQVLWLSNMTYVCIEEWVNQADRLPAYNFESIFELLIELRDRGFKIVLQRLCMTGDCRSAHHRNESSVKEKTRAERVVIESPEVREW